MNYNDNLAYEAKAEQKSSAFSSLEQRFINQTETQSKMIYEIADKLHAILNKRTPADSNKTLSGTDERQLTDLYSRFQSRLDVMDLNNERLRLILTHLNDIV